MYIEVFIYMHGRPKTRRSVADTPTKYLHMLCVFIPTSWEKIGVCVSQKNHPLRNEKNQKMSPSLLPPFSLWVEQHRGIIRCSTFSAPLEKPGDSRTKTMMIVFWVVGGCTRILLWLVFPRRSNDLGRWERDKLTMTTNCTKTRDLPPSIDSERRVVQTKSS